MKRIVMAVLIFTVVFSLAACAEQLHPIDAPDDFCVYLEWGCNGDSTYDSRTGKLVKQKIASGIEEYTTTFWLSDEQKTEIFTLISNMDPETYPDEYNPLRGQSKPSRNIILTITYSGKTKTITCKGVTLDNTPKGSMGKKFMAVHDKIVEILTSSTEWQALPDYEFYYD